MIQAYKMANKNEAAHHSDTASSVDMPSVRGLNKNDRHPEEWTLPQEWNMEKRELFQNWKMDVQNQISNIAGNLQRSLTEFPNSDVEKKFDYTDEFIKAEIQKEQQHYARLGGATLNLGLHRVPERAYPDKY